MSGPERILVLLRHGESVWNRENRFTGWADVPLTGTGHEQARRSGDQLREAGIVPAVAHTSVLQRAIHTLEEVLDRLDGARPPIRYAWELNERHYGRLQGKNKAETEREFGPDQTLAWRRSYADPPPPVDLDDPRHPRFDERYADVPVDSYPAGESLRDTGRRVLPYWDRRIVPDLASGPVLVVAHGNSLRSLVMHLEGHRTRRDPAAEHPDRHTPGVPAGRRSSACSASATWPGKRNSPTGSQRPSSVPEERTALLRFDFSTLHAEMRRNWPELRLWK